MLPDLLQDLTSENNDGSGTVTNFSILRSGNVDENSSGGMNDIQELFRSILATRRHAQRCSGFANLHNGCAVVGNGLSSILIHHQQITSIGAESRLDGGLDSQAHVDIGDNLSLALGGIGS